MTMFAASTARMRRGVAAALAAMAISLLIVVLGWGRGLPAAEAQAPVPAAPQAPAAQVPAAEQPAAKLVVNPPLPGPLTRGVALIQFRTENLQIVPVFGPTAAAVSPRIGHLHVTLDDAAWHWAHTSNDPLIVADLPPGPHKLLVELADADHKVLAQEVVKFEIARR
jgi:hypothetical protein